jgi:hypothetical protein
MSRDDKKQHKRPENYRRRKQIKDDVWDPTGYFRNKARREDDALKGCLWIIVAMAIAALLAVLSQCAGGTWMNG